MIPMLPLLDFLADFSSPVVFNDVSTDFVLSCLPVIIEVPIVLATVLTAWEMA